MGRLPELEVGSIIGESRLVDIPSHLKDTHLHHSTFVVASPTLVPPDLTPPPLRYDSQPFEISKQAPRSTPPTLRSGVPKLSVRKLSRRTALNAAAAAA
jgi:hypothetical protein